MGEDVDGRWLPRRASPALGVHRVPVVRRRFCNQQFTAPGLSREQKAKRRNPNLAKGIPKSGQNPTASDPDQPAKPLQSRSQATHTIQMVVGGVQPF